MTSMTKEESSVIIVCKGGEGVVLLSEIILHIIIGIQ